MDDDFDFSSLDDVLNNIISGNAKDADDIDFSPDSKPSPMQLHRHMVKTVKHLRKIGRSSSKIEFELEQFNLNIGSIQWIVANYPALVAQLDKHLSKLAVICAERAAKRSAELYRSQTKALKFYNKTLESMIAEYNTSPTNLLLASIGLQKIRVDFQRRMVNTLDWIESSNRLNQTSTYSAEGKAPSDFNRIVWNATGKADYKGSARVNNPSGIKPNIYR